MTAYSQKPVISVESMRLWTGSIDEPDSNGGNR